MYWFVTTANEVHSLIDERVAVLYAEEIPECNVFMANLTLEGIE